MKSRNLKLLVIFISVLVVVGNVYARTGTSDKTSHLDVMRTALAQEHYLDAYDEVFMLYDSAPADLVAALATKPETELDQQARMFLLLFSGHPNQALTDVDALPKNTFSYVVAAAANDLLGNGEDSTTSFGLALKGTSDAAQLNGLMAAAAFTKGAPDEILRYSNQAIELNANLAAVYRLHGIGVLFSGDPKAALSDAGHSIQLDPSVYFFHYLRANAYFALEDPANALIALDTALALEPNSFIGNAMRSNANKALGNLEQATLDFARAVEVRTNEVIKAEPLVPGEPVQLTMSFSRTFSLPFKAKTGQEVSINITSVNSGEVDPVILLVNSKGVPLAYNDDASDETMDAGIQEYKISESGTYTLMVSHANGGSEGDIKILVSLR